MLHFYMLLTTSRPISVGPVASEADTADEHGHSIIILSIVALVTVANTGAVRGLQEATDASFGGGHTRRGARQPAQKCKHYEGPHCSLSLYQT